MLSVRSILALVAVATACVVVLGQSPPATAPLYYSWSASQTVTLVQANSTSTTAGTSAWQQDSEFNRTATFSTSGTNFLADFEQQTIFFLDENAVCQFTCDIQAQVACSSSSNVNTLCDADQLNSKLVGTATIDGVETYEYLWQDLIGTSPMATHQLWVTQDAEPLPVQLFINYHPFDTWNANETIAFSDFVNATPDASAFAISNEAQCYPGTESECAEIRRRIAPFLVNPKKILTEE